MRLVVSGFVLGTLLCQQLGKLPSLHWTLCLLLLVPALFYIRFKILGLIFAVLCGFLWSVFVAHTILENNLPANLEGKDLQVTGTISSIPKYTNSKVRFQMQVNSIKTADEQDKNEIYHVKTVILSWYKEPPRLRVGDQWQLLVRLKQPHGYMNPGGNDYETRLFQQRINALGYVKAALASPDQLNSHSLINKPIKTMNYRIGNLRQIIREAIYTGLDEPSYAGIITALSVGDRQGISPDQWQILTKTGTNHLMAISGLHIGLITGIVFFLIRRLWAYSPVMVRYINAPQAAAVMATATALVYAALAGFAIPTQRALIMVAVVMLAIILKRHSKIGNSLFLALLLVLIIDPLAVISAGFWLSFAAVGVIVYGLNQRIGSHGIWSSYGKVQYLTLLGLIPLLVLFFQQFSIVSPFANIIAVPWMSLVSIPLSLMGSMVVVVAPGLGSGLLELAQFSLDLLWPILVWFATFEFSVWHIETPPVWVLLIAGVGLVWLLAPRGFPSRWVGLVLIAPLFSVRHESTPIAFGEAIFTLLDVGQGLSAVIQTKNYTLLYDTGPSYGENFDTGKVVVVPFLHFKQIDHVDAMIISHGDNDHIGGAKSVIDSMAIRQIVTSDIEKIRYAKPIDCHSQNNWQWDGVTFEILHPKSGYLKKYRKGNNRSCVLRIVANGRSVLLTGDIEKKVEYDLVRKAANGNIDLIADILVVPHHGSETSSSDQFIDAVKPKFALFPVGYKNRYGFPKQRVVERYLQRGIDIYDTSQYGAITFTLGTSSSIILPDVYRHSARKYWHWNTQN